MAEPEELISDAARHLTVHVRELWCRHRAHRDPARPAALADVAQRLDLLLSAAFGGGFALRVAQPPAPETLLTRLFRRAELPRAPVAVPATDGASIWLPAQLDVDDDAASLRLYRAMALQQAMRARRGSARTLPVSAQPLVRDLYLLLEAHAADRDLVEALPGMAEALAALRDTAARRRPPLEEFAPARRPLEEFARRVLATSARASPPDVAHCAEPGDSLREAERLCARLAIDARAARTLGAKPLLRDEWLGELHSPPEEPSFVDGPAQPVHDLDAPPARGARLRRRPEVRTPRPDEDERQEPGVWMVQLDTPHEHAEDPFGLQRPVDRDEETSADEFADSVADLAQARLVAAPGRPKEVLLSDDAPTGRTRRDEPAPRAAEALDYPEWDYRTGEYRMPGARVHCLDAPLGPQQWVDRTLAEHRPLLEAIRRRFELLRARRMWLRRRIDGDEIDIDACVQAWSDFRAGRPLAQSLYQSLRPARRDLATLLLVDVSGSTDGWISAHRRIVDVEREALLLVCIALEEMRDRYAVHAFSGEGPSGVTVRTVKSFDERFTPVVAQRIAALEPDRYTRAGAALRHATALLMREAATHRLLLLLSDGKPNDVDRYEGRYGVEDMRQAVTEAKAQGIFPFCLTVDRHAAAYLPAVFGAGHYALLSHPQRLPESLVGWLKRLASG